MEAGRLISIDNGYLTDDKPLPLIVPIGELTVQINDLVHLKSALDRSNLGREFGLYLPNR